MNAVQTDESKSGNDADASPVHPADRKIARGPPAAAVARPGRTRALLTPVVVIMLLGLAVLVGLIVYFARAQDRTAIQDSAAIVRSSLEVEKQHIADILDSYAWWDEAVGQVTRKPDPAWLDDNFGSYQTQSHQITASFVVNPADRTIIAFINGRAVKVDAFQSLKGGLDLLIKWTRASSQIEPAAATGILMVGDQPMIVGAEAITPELGSLLWPAGYPRFVLIFGRPVDQALLDRVASRAGIDALHVSRRGGMPGIATLPLAGPAGYSVATLTWTPDLPAQQMVLSLLPFVGVLIVAMAGLLWWFLSRVRSVADALHRQAVVIDQIQDTIVGTDAEGAIASWNTGAARMFGYGRDQVIGQPISLVYPDMTASMLAVEVGAFKAGEECVELRVSAKKMSGDVFPAHVSLFPARNSLGEVAGTVGYGLDISAQKGLEAKLEELATVDELTGAYNRRFLLRYGPLEVQRAKRFNRPLSFLFLDLDHFKRVNDRLGHQFGDLVLTMFAAVCRKALRPSDVFVRYGGEEFLAMLPETTLEQALAVARRLAGDLRQTVFSVDPPFRGLTVSIGASDLRETDDALEKIIERIDRATYRAKELGRDRIEVAPS